MLVECLSSDRIALDLMTAATDAAVVVLVLAGGGGGGENSPDTR